MPDEQKSDVDVGAKVKSVGGAFWDKFVSLFFAAMSGIIVAAAWNDAVKTVFDSFVSIENVILAKFIYAIAMTIVVVLLGFKISGKEKKKEEEN